LGFEITYPDYSWSKPKNANGHYTNSIDGWMNEPDLQFLFATSKKMRHVVEIGSWKGRSTHALCSGCPGMVHSVDTFQGGDEPQAKAVKEYAKWYDVYGEFKRNVGHFPNLAVHKKRSLEAAKEFHDGSIDMVFIDGGHAYDEVKADIEAWLPKAKKMICGHDYTHDEDGAFDGVVLAVDGLLGPVNIVPGGRIWYKELSCQ
jgi:hypothetical protein